jgi:hypothetical protein
MTRPLDRGLLERKRRAKALVYRARYDESALVARSPRERLQGTSADVRKLALLNLVEGLEQDDLDDRLVCEQGETGATEGMSAVALAVAVALPGALGPYLAPLPCRSRHRGHCLDARPAVARLDGRASGHCRRRRARHRGPVEAARAWCWHEVLPDMPSWLGFAEDPVAHAAVAVPAVVLATALVAQAIGLLRSWPRLRHRRAAPAVDGPSRRPCSPTPKSCWRPTASDAVGCPCLTLR